MAQRSLGLPPGPLAAYLGVRNANQDADEESVGLLAKIQAIQEARAQRGNDLAERERHNKEMERLQGQARPVANNPIIQTDQGIFERTPTGLVPLTAPGTTTPLKPKAEQRPHPIVQTAQGIFERRPEGLVRLNEPGNPSKPLMPTSIAGGGTLSPQALSFTAKQYLAGDRQSIQGYARNATARIALQNAIVDEATNQGLSPAQVAAKMAEYAGLTAGSRTVGQRAANISLAATEALEMIPIVQETSDKFARTSFVPWNMALRAYETGTGSPEVAEFGAALNALVNVYARAINPTGVPTVSDKEHARAVINSVHSSAQVKGVLGIISRELEIAKKAPSQVTKSITQSITGGGNPAQGAWSDADEARFQELQRKLNSGAQ